MTILWWPEVYRAFDLRVPISVGAGVTGVTSGPANFGLEVPVGVGASAAAISSGEFGIEVPVGLGMQGPESADLFVPINVGMAGTEQYSTVADLSVPVDIGAVGTLSGGPFRLSVPVGIGMVGHQRGFPMYIGRAMPSPDGAILRWHGPGRGSPSTLFSLDMVRGVAADVGGNAYFAYRNAVYRYGPIDSRIIMTNITDPWGLAVSRNGENVYVAHGSVITRWNRTSGSQANIMTGLNLPTGVAVDGNGWVYVAQNGSGVVTRWAGSGSVSNIITGLTNPWGVAVSSGGENVYVSQYASSSSIVRWNRSTGARSNIVSGLNRPRGVAVDNSGSVYFVLGDPAVANSNVIYRWDSGSGLTLLLANLNQPSFIALTPD